MNHRNTIVSLYLLAAVLFISQNLVFAGPMGAPTPLLPNNATNNPYVFSTPRTVANGYYLNTWYQYSEKDRIGQTSSAFANSPASQEWGSSDSKTIVYANPGTFEAKAYQLASTTGLTGIYSYGSSQVWNWYVLTGAPGAVKLAADILVQGKAFANYNSGGNAATIFAVELGILTYPTDLEQDYVMEATGTVGWTDPFSKNNTISENLIWTTGGETHDINYLIRSQSFTVTPGVPFRLIMTTATQGFAGPGALGEAWSDFYDPSLQMIYVDLGEGNYSPLGAQGYSISTVPLPGAVWLLGSGLLGLLGLKRKFLG